ncbi:CpaD family pilus assembly lipoprotein [Bradyrhizobium sp. SSUT77]|uniref:CpaD family pilus assembly lipoprotein n=1 Tax=Bradyrhizobium sp. SSUT77 TaxID=3040603 RepID=UPI00244CDDF6|nr:CpaD family pilus assembly lipoprotein [Bradyrhizobium sp. SSUT77]MDH2345504.1 CpaD family pilus assembly lipoprotein [Bradyrhizobium sp. SSUT77]
MSLRHLYCLIAISASVGGCTNSSAIYSGHAERTIRIEQKTSVLLLQGVRRVERSRLRDFIASASRGRRDALHLDVTGSPRLIAQVAHDARAMGVTPLNIRLSDSALSLPAHFGVRIEATIYEAHPAICPPLSIVGPSVDDNSFNPTLGCSIQNNLGVMVNEPGDLLGNEAVVPTSGDRAVLPFPARRTITPTDHGNLEHGTQNRVLSEGS